MKVYLDPIDAEEWPTGTFGGPRPTTTATSPEQAAEHRAALLAALRKPPDPTTEAA
ncbi:hypothetical protein [Streptomyces niveus]|uniref:hypothetical protein n=1 Tax=Streptomyces niveus TaxID=193462 RepID=UPI003870E444